MANEVRLIDANEIRQDWLENGQNEYVYDTNAVLDSIDEQPTIDPESLRPKGRWKLYGNDDDCGCSYFCSNCHWSYPEEWFWDHGQYMPFKNCPNCGAKMKGVDNG